MNAAPLLEVRRLSADSAADRRDLQRVLTAAPGYSRIVTGRLPSENAALDEFSSLAPGTSPADKHVLGFYQAGTAVGCADVVRGYPERHTAYIGLLLFAESFQGRSLGPQAIAEISALARGWGCIALRLGVIETNTRALSFWQREGFVERYRKDVADFTGRAIVMQRRLG